MKTYKVTDGEFTSFPDVDKKSVDNLTNRGYKNLFPI